MADQILPLNQDIRLIVHEIGDLLASARSNVARQVNSELLSTYWNIGRIIAEYALGGLSNNVFASRYVLYMPDREQLIAQVEAVLEKRKGNGSEA